jgi:hypothetical protein
MIDILWVGVAAYLAVGVYMTGPGPIGDELRRYHARELPLVGSTTPRWKWILYFVLVGVTSVLAWPTYFVRVGRGPIPTTTLSLAKIEREPGLYFMYMGGAGTLTCRACAYQQKLTSFIHGHTEGPDRWCKAAYQCRICHKFTYVESRGYVKEDVPNCDCGGELTRDDVLVCPSCGDKAVSYRMEWIT